MEATHPFGCGKQEKDSKELGDMTEVPSGGQASLGCVMRMERDRRLALLSGEQPQCLQFLSQSSVRSTEVGVWGWC